MPTVLVTTPTAPQPEVEPAPVLPPVPEPAPDPFVPPDPDAQPVPLQPDPGREFETCSLPRVVR